MLFEAAVVPSRAFLISHGGVLVEKAVLCHGSSPVPGYWDGQCFISSVLTRCISVFNFQQGYPVPKRV